MFTIRFLIPTVLCFLLMGVTSAFAGMHSHHQHEGHSIEAASPFEKESDTKPLHCLLNNHKHNGGFCPHTSRPSNNDGEPSLSMDCGGKAPGAIPSFSFHKDNIHNSWFIAGLNTYSFILSAGNFSSSQKDLNSQDPPPEVL